MEEDDNMKKKFIATIIITMVSTLLVGCGNGASNISEDTQISTTEDVTIEENSTNENSSD